SPRALWPWLSILRQRGATVGSSEHFGRGVANFERDVAGEDLPLPRALFAMTFHELGHDLRREQLQAAADVLVRVAARLVEEDHLVDVGLLELAELGPDRVGRTDETARVHLLRGGCLAELLVLLPEAGCTDLARWSRRVVAEGEREERPPLGLDVRLFVGR